MLHKIFKHRFVNNTGKKTAKSLGLVGLCIVSGLAYADPIDGYWVYYDNQQPKYVVSVSTNAQGVNGVVVAGTKNHKGKTVLSGVKPQGNGKYTGGKAFNPLTGSSYDVDLTLTGDVLSMRAYKGLPTFGITKTLKRLPKGYTFTTGS